MPRYTVIFDRDAEADLISIRNYMAEVRDPVFAVEFVDRIIAYCERFGDLPHRGTRRDEIVDEQKQVNILGVFYGGRDVFALIRERRS